MNAKTMRSMAAVVALGATVANAATWTKGNWSVAENWAEGVVPDAGAAVIIDNQTAGATFNVDVDSVDISSLTFASGGKQCYVVGGTLNISAQAAVVANHSMTISNSLVLSHSTPKLSAATSGRSYYCGDVTLTHATGDLYSFGKGGSTFYGTVTVPRDFRPGGGAAWQSGSHHYFYGPLKCRHVLNASSYDDTTYHYESTSNSWTYFETGNYVRNAVATAGALPKTAVLRAYGSDNYAGGSCNLNGTDQTIDRLSGTTKLLAVNGGSSAMTLTMLATASDTSKATLNGALSLVYAPTNSSYIQTINGGACSMDGSLTVSNGTFRAGVNTKFAKVKSIVVADGATFDLATTNANALVGVTSIVLGAGAHFAITNAAATPFAASAVTLEMDETSTFDLPEGANYLFAAVTVGGVPLDGDTYTGGGVAPQFSGSGSITVPDVEQPTVDATWTGEGETDGIAVSGNWGGTTPALNAKSLYPLFASGGEQATIDRALDFKGVHFGGAAGSFDLVSGGDAANLAVRQLGFAVDAAHTSAVDVPVKVKSDQTWTIGSASTLEFKKPVTMDTAYAVTVSGAGATTGSGTSEKITSVLRLDGENGFLGGFSANGVFADVYSPTNAFGPASDEPVKFSNSMLWLRGSVIERPIEISGQNNKYYWFNTWGTNVFTKMFTHRSDAYWRPYFHGRIVSEGGVTVNCQVFFSGDSTAEWFVRGKPWKHTGVTSSVCELQMNGGNIHFEVDGNLLPELFINSTGQVHCHVDDPFNGRSTIVLNMASGSGGLHLHGHDVAFGSIATMAAGTVDSDVPGGVLRLTAQNASITNKAVRFTGAAGFTMCGTGAVVFTNAIESAGSVSVTNGRLEFTETGSWFNCTNVTASGTGRLKIAQPRTFRSRATLTVADSGVVELAEGVCHSFRHVFIGGKEVEPGVYAGEEGPSSANKTHAANFAGKGSIRVYGDGFLVVVH